MSKFGISIALTLNLFLLPITARPIPGTTTIEVKDFFKKEARQQTAVWCWAACLQMLLNSQGQNWEQQEVVHYVKGKMAIETASNEEIARALDGWKFDAHGKKWASNCLFFPTTAPASIMVRFVGILNVPLIIGIDGHHVVMLHKITYETTPGEPLISSIVYYDPWDGMEKPFIWTSVAPHITGTWVAHVATNRLFSNPR